MKQLVVLGATGSIGRQALDVAESLAIPVRVLAANRVSGELRELADRFPDADVIAAHPDVDLPSGWRGGEEAVIEAAGLAGCTVVNGIVGAAGFRASISALEAGNRLALANKESMIAGGPVVLAALEKGGGELLPVDSEHSAIFQCLLGESPESVDRLVLTASGGPFRGWSPEELADVSVEQALAHPTWNMGPRITIDSATLANKGLEVIEAHFLFGIGFDHIDVVIHPQSIVHSLVQFNDGALKAHVGWPDMRIPIQYAITYPERAPLPLEPFDLTAQSLTFEPVDREAFPALDLAFEAGRAGGSAPAVFNAADEVAAAAFIKHKIGFTDIYRVLEKTLAAVAWTSVRSVEDVVAADQAGRRTAQQLIEEMA